MPPTGTHESFRFGLGHVALEFVATLAGRLGEPVDRLREPEDLADWLEQAGLESGTRCDRRLLAEARELREAVYGVLDRARRGKQPSQADIELINSWAARPVRVAQIGPRLTRTWTESEAVEAGLAQLARASVDLITGPDLALIRNCADRSCSLLFIDQSRPGRRRWCSMERCGNRAKTARYRERNHPVRSAARST
jgi:predicted RNA-binding Zn ribbon-like protein